MLKLPLSPLLSDSAASTWERAADKRARAAGLMYNSCDVLRSSLSIH